MEFFSQPQVAKLKLNKGEKRALKFALKRGENLDNISDLKGYLQ